MAAASEVTSANIRAQDFCELDDETNAQINYPLRLSPAIHMIGRPAAWRWLR